MDDKISELVRVRSWDDYVGQNRLKTHIDIKIRAAVQAQRLLDHTLLIAPPGSGKSTIVDLIADRVGDQLLCLPMPMALNDFLYAIEGFIGGIVFLDEVHNAPRAFQEALQFGLQDGYIPGKFGERVSTKHITFIAATTTGDQQRLLAPLVQRFKYRPSWEPYSHEEMTQIVLGMADRAGAVICPEVCSGLASAAGGNPRAVQDLVAAARDLGTIGMDVTVDAVLDLAGLDSDGLTYDHIEYLRTLHLVGGTAGLSLLTSMLSMNAQSVQDLERALIARGFLRRGPGGRKLMPPGRAKIDQAGDGPADPIARRRVTA